jgi:DNA-directed RNA polymerase specialized sigma24 family protein
MCVQLVDPSSALEGKVPLSTLDNNAILEEYDGYIRYLAYQFIPRRLICADVLDLEIDEVVQTVRVKFWEALSQREIKNHKAYLRRMVYNEAVNYKRRAKFRQALDTDEEGEPYYGTVLLSQSESTLDPLDVLVEKESINEHIHRAVDAVMSFPALQRKAVLCVFKDRVDYIHELYAALRVHHVDGQELNWSSCGGTLHSMKVSASLAKKKLKALQRASLQTQ